MLFQPLLDQLPLQKLLVLVIGALVIVGIPFRSWNYHTDAFAADNSRKLHLQSIFPPITSHQWTIPGHHFSIPTALPRIKRGSASLASCSTPTIRFPRPSGPQFRLREHSRRTSRYLRPWKENQESRVLQCIPSNQRSL
jgi:hypothetical protein